MFRTTNEVLALCRTSLPGDHVVEADPLIQEFIQPIHVFLAPDAQRSGLAPFLVVALITEPHAGEIRARTFMEMHRV